MFGSEIDVPASGVPPISVVADSAPSVNSLEDDNSVFSSCRLAAGWGAFKPNPGPLMELIRPTRLVNGPLKTRPNRNAATGQPKTCSMTLFHISVTPGVYHQNAS